MSHREMNLHVYHIDKWAMDLVQLFDLDADYSGENGDEYWEFTNKRDDKGELISLAVANGFKTEAERLLSEIDDHDSDDHTRIGVVLDYIAEFCHGSYSSQFTYEILEEEGGYSVAVSFLT